MSTVEEYFAENRPAPKYHPGDRVIGKYHGVPFVGTVGGDTLINFTVGSVVTVFLDLPFKYKNEWYETFVNVKYKDIKKISKIIDDTVPIVEKAKAKKKLK